MKVIRLTYPKPYKKGPKCLSCKIPFQPLGYEPYGSVGGFFCVPCIEKHGKNWKR